MLSQQKDKSGRRKGSEARCNFKKHIGSFHYPTF
ncbi:hypothetical protein [Pedobacter superstes]